ncbi:hypothetical protein [Clostridium chrysemydis]|uniref:hypothetical protein n=1 Tax=Clostridium chrysemydis TaxID=2665504 RepID=UPI001883439E|nr:hypothetical protein [Clostridium chrysemydis]
MFSGIFIVSSSIFIYMYTNRYEVKTFEEEIDSKLFLKGVKESKAIAKDNEGYLYIAYENEITKITDEGKVLKSIKNRDFSIEDIEIKGDRIYILSKDKLYSLNLDGDEKREIVKDIPFGDDLDRKLLGKDDDIYLSIGTFTNSGIAKESEFFYEKKKDLSPIDLKLRGINYGKKNTGAFKEFGDSSKEGEKINKSKIGNASLIKIDVNKEKIETFSSGVKDIKGIDYKANGEIYAAVSGMKNEGDRPVLRDSDYIYNLKEDSWYGWPDFSGGDPISSPRFTDNLKIENLLLNPPKESVYGPYYQHNSVDSIECLAIDREGVILEKDSILYFDSKTKELLSLNEKKELTKIIALKEGNEIIDILFLKDKCLLLEKENGVIYEIYNSDLLSSKKVVPKAIIIIVVIITLIALVIVVNKILKRKYR